MQKKELEQLTGKIIHCAIIVHDELGPGLLESVYEHCLAEELYENGIIAHRQVALPVVYKGKVLSKEFRMDIVADDEVIIEIKAVDQILPVHASQMITYLKLADKPIGSLLNFDVTVMKSGIRRYYNPKYPDLRFRDQK